VIGSSLSVEAGFQAELYRLLKNLVAGKFSVDSVVFDNVEFERRVDSGRADIVIVSSGKPFIVIETKREKVGRTTRNIDPLSPDVIGQAAGYALMLGAPYFVTANPEFVASFTMPSRPGERLDITRHRIKFWHLKEVSEDFCRELLETIARFHIASEEDRAKIRTPLDWAFIIRLRSFVSWFSKLMASSLKNKLKVDKNFKIIFEEYSRSRGLKIGPEQFAKEISYIFMNKIIFYKILERHYKDLPRLNPIEENNAKKFISRLQEFFDKAIEVTGDFEAVFKTGIYDYVVLPEDPGSLRDAIDDVNAFIKDMDYYRLEDFGADIIGHVYEDLIEPEERHQLGQFYTPPAIAELITKWCIRSPDDKILDPAVGSGTFLVKAYSRLKGLKLIENPKRSDRVIHREIIGQLYAIDIDSFPAHLTSMNLAMRDVREPVSEINVINEDFFKVEPRQTVLTGYRVRTPKGEVGRKISIPLVDVVVANPPYTRWTEIPDNTREAIGSRLSDLLRKYNLTARVQQGIEPGIYIHFIMHAWNFLKPSGRLGMIISDSWLQTDYGIDFGRYLLENWKVKAIIDISARVFPIPLIGTCIILLEKPINGEDLEENEVIFAYLDVPENKIFNIDAILKALERPEEYGEQYLIKKIKQKDIPRDQKWINNIFNPEEILSKLRSKTIPAGQLFEASYGNATYLYLASKRKVHGPRNLGANSFFYLNKEKVEYWGLEEYAYPAITSARYVKFFSFTEEDWRDIRDRGRDCYIFICHKPRNELPGNVREYIKWGETECRTRIRETRGGGKPCHLAQACQERERQRQHFYGWYDLGGVENARIIGIRNSQYKVRFFRNTIGAVSYDNSICMIDKNGLDESRINALLAYLNSTFTHLYVESTGVISGGGIIQLNVEDMEEMPIIDVNNLDEDELSELVMLFDRLDSEARRLGGADKRENIEKLWDSIITEIDYKVAEILGLPKSLADEARILSKIMMHRRLQRAGEAKPQALRGEEEYRISKPPKTRKRRIIEDDKHQSRLDNIF